MADNLGRVDPVSRHFLDRGGREEPYQGRHSKKQPGPREESSSGLQGGLTQEDDGETAGKNHIDLRI